ncbi:MAG TPA: hypothetical protein VHW43_04845, partial [Puia sp.]|nr:hypothetical protein [Puia sp.]
MPTKKILARLLLPLLLLPSICPMLTRAQKPYLYEFNKNAELIKGPPANFVPGHTFDVRIPFDTVLFKGQVDSLLMNLLQARIYWGSLVKKIKAQTAAGKKWQDEVLRL